MTPATHSKKSWDRGKTRLKSLGRHLLILPRNATEFSGPKVIWDGLKDNRNMFSDQMSTHFSLFLGKMDFGFYVPKMKKTIQTVTNEKCKNRPVWWCGGVSVPTAWVTCIYVKGTYWLQRLMLEFCQRHMLPSRWQLFPGTPCLFQQDDARPHSARVTTA